MAFGAMTRSELRYLNLLLIIPLVGVLSPSIPWKTLGIWLAIYVPLAWWWFVVRAVFFPNPFDSNAIYGNLYLDFGSLALLAAALPLAKVLWRRVRPSTLHILMACAVAILAISLVSADEFIVAIVNLRQLLCCDSGLGLWGLFWPLVATVLVLAFAADDRKEKLYVGTVVLGFVTWRIAAYTLLRDSGVNDWSPMGSGSRVLTLIVPVIVYYVLYVAFRRLQGAQ